MKAFIPAIFLLSLLHTSMTCAKDATVDADFRQRLQQLFPGVEITSIKATPITDVYQVAAGNEYIYISRDGRYLLQGDMIDMEQKWNLTEQARADWRKEKFARVDEKDMITFKAENEQFEIYAFTDIDCGYCRKLHKEIDQLNNIGITVHYLAYPVLGEFTKGWAAMAEVWCSDDRNEALTRAKLGDRDGLASGKSTDDILACSDTIKKQFELANDFKVVGTPALYLDNGAAIEGYMPADKLLQKIREMKADYESITYNR